MTYFRFVFQFHPSMLVFIKKGYKLSTEESNWTMPSVLIILHLLKSSRDITIINIKKKSFDIVLSGVSEQMPNYFLLHYSNNDAVNMIMRFFYKIHLDSSNPKFQQICVVISEDKTSFPNLY